MRWKRKRAGWRDVGGERGEERGWHRKAQWYGPRTHGQEERDRTRPIKFPIVCRVKWDFGADRNWNCYEVHVEIAEIAWRCSEHNEGVTGSKDREGVAKRLTSGEINSHRATSRSEINLLQRRGVCNIPRIFYLLLTEKKKNTQRRANEKVHKVRCREISKFYTQFLRRWNERV